MRLTGDKQDLEAVANGVDGYEGAVVAGGNFIASRNNIKLEHVGSRMLQGGDNVQGLFGAHIEVLNGAAIGP